MSSLAQRRAQTMANNFNGQVPTDINIAIVGALGAGKSALTVKYITRRFIGEYDPDLEDIYGKTETIDQREIRVKLMDTCDKPGKDPNRYMKWADAFLVVYSITNRQSFETAQNYLEGISQYQRPSSSMETPTILVGNKVDMERYRQVSKAEGSALGAHYDSAFIETTAAEDFECVELIFHEGIREVLREHQRCTPLRPLYISEDRAGPKASRSKDHLDSAGQGHQLQEKNSRFKIFNKGKGGFKAIFQST